MERQWRDEWPGRAEHLHWREVENKAGWVGDNSELGKKMSVNSSGD